MIGALEQHIAAEVHHARVLRRERNRGVPVEAVFVPDHRITHRAHPIGIRIDGFLRAGARVGDVEHAALRIGVDEPRLRQIRNGKEAVATRHGEPVTLENAAKHTATGSAPVAVVLQTAARHVRFLHVVVDVIELRERKRVHHLPRFRRVVAYLPPAVRPLHNTSGVERVDPHGLMITVYTLRDGAKVHTAIFRQVQRSGQRVHAVRIHRVHAQVGVIERPEVDVGIAIHHAPMRAGVVGAPQLALGFRFGDHVHNARVAGCHRDTNAIHLTLGKPDVAIFA